MRLPAVMPVLLRRAPLLALLAACSASAQQVPDVPAPEIAMLSYTVSLPERQAHRVHVRLTLDAVPADGVVLAMPVWTPGSYLVREFSRNVLDVSASDASGRALAVEKVDKNSWRVAKGGAATVHVDYTLYANERSVRTSHVDDGHAFLSPAATFLFVRGSLDAPHRVEVLAPDGWSVSTALPREGADGGAGGGANGKAGGGAGGEAFLAPDYDTLVDSPIEVGPHRVLDFEEQGVPFRIVLAGEGALDEEALRRDVQAIVAEVGTVFGGPLPFESYTFLFELVDNGGGGLEHKDSCVCMVTRWTLHQKKEYRAFLALVAHEYFHAWNVKRFRPAALGPFDYDRENYTRDLWVAEGITSYYDDLCTVRAGFADKPAEYLDALAASFRDIAELPGARRMSLARASHDAWIKHYRPDENSRNSAVSYYTKGALVALMLDLRIRRLTRGERSLADALRLGWQEHASQGRGYPEGAMLDLVTRTAGTDLSGFFADYVDGTRELDADAELAWVGLRLARTAAASERPLARDADGFLLAPDLGIATADEGGLCRVTVVLEDGPAFEAGLNVGDVLLGVDDMRVTHATLQDRLDRTRGEPVELSAWRGQELRRLTVQPRLLPLADWKLAPLESATDEQRAAFEEWCGMEAPQPAERAAAPVVPPAEPPPH